MPLQEDQICESDKVKDQGLLRITYPILKIQGWIFGPIILYNHFLRELTRQGATYPEELSSIGKLYGNGILLILGAICLIDFIISIHSGKNIFNMFDTGRYFPIIKHVVLSLIMIMLCSLTFGLILMYVYGSEYVPRFG